MKVALKKRARIPGAPRWALLLVMCWLSTVALLSRIAGTPRVPCPFRAITGVPCATCGSTRAGLAIMDGRIIDAFAFNPLVFALGLAAALVLGFRLIAARQIVLIIGRRERVALWCAAGAIFIANWGYVISRHAHAAEAAGPSATLSIDARTP